MAVGTLAIGGAPPALRWLYAMRELQHEAVLRLLEPRQGELPKKAFEAAAQVQYGVSVFFDNASRVNLVWQKTTFDRSRPDDSILLLICVLVRFDNEIVRDASERLTSQAWSWNAIEDGGVQGYAISRIDLPF